VLALVAANVVACEPSVESNEEPTSTLQLRLGGGTMARRGVNLAGADFGSGQLPGTYNADYTYPTRAEVDYYMAKGMTAFRLPFLWERLQRQLTGSFDSTELGRLNDIVTYATSKGASVILDPHNYARYRGNIVGSNALPASALADFWSKLATQFKANSRVDFGLMNEPNTMPTEQWRDAANAAIVAIRATGAKNLILVPGNAWTGAHSWSQNWYGTPNAQALLGVVDSGNNYAFDVHQYLDGDSSGTVESCTSATIGSERMRTFTQWLRTHGKRGFLGEFGGGRNNTCSLALDDMLAHLDANADVYLGWTYWAGGPWWGDYIYTLEPNNGVDRPQMSVLVKHLQQSAPTTTPVPTPPATPTPTPVPTPTPTPIPSPSPAPISPPTSSGAGLSGTISITNEWSTGYCAEIKIANAGSAAAGPWTLVFDAQQATPTQLWNGLVSRSSNRYTVTPLAWNQSVAAKGSISVGYCADKTGSAFQPKIVSVAP